MYLDIIHGNNQSTINVKNKFIEFSLGFGRTMEEVMVVSNYLFKYANTLLAKSKIMTWAMISYQMSYAKANFPKEFKKMLEGKWKN